VGHREANTFALLLVALLEHGQPMTLVEIAARFEQAGIADRSRALLSLRRCNPGRPPVYPREPRFGAVHAARRVARSLFLGSAPSSSGTQKGTRGVDRARVLLGCVQPGQPSAAFSDALNRLCDRLHYLNSSGDKAQDSTRFWFD